MSEITESEERLARPLIRLAKLVGVGTSYLGMSHDYHEIDDDVLIEVLAALGHRRLQRERPTHRHPTHSERALRPIGGTHRAAYRR